MTAPFIAEAERLAAEALLAVPNAWPRNPQEDQDLAAEHARAAVAAVVPILAEHFAQAVEAAGRPAVQWLAEHATDDIDRARLIGAEDAYKDAIRVVREAATPTEGGTT